MGHRLFFKIAEQGGAGINLHGGYTPGRYSPIYFLNGEYHAAPIYYSMLLFHQAARGQVVPVECKTSAKLAVHAVIGNDHKLRVVLINKDLMTWIVASVTSKSSNTKAEVIRLRAPSITSTEGVTLAGNAVAKDGTWTPQPAEKVPCVNVQFVVSLPATSAALLTIE